jgi:predicted ChrR family anti-sigma factor
MDLFHPEGWEKKIPWKRLHAGVEIHRLYGDGIDGPTAALLRFAPGASIPEHEHTGYEHILVLAGAQADGEGEVRAGELRIHQPGWCHSVWSEKGCLVLAIYEKPVVFTGNGDTGA